MPNPDLQKPLFNNEDIAPDSEMSPAAAWDRDTTKRALDELFSLTRQYRSSKAYRDLLQFVARFRFYSPFNAMLVHVQMPGARFVAPPHRWLRDYNRRIKSGARPLVILQPMGPVMFVFDVSETEPINNAQPLPPEVEKPFEIRNGQVGYTLELVIGNAKRDGIRTTKSYEGSQSAGSIRRVAKDVIASQKFHAGTVKHRKPVMVDISVKYDIVINTNLSREAQYVTIVHELAHLYCGHLGTPNNRWWPDRRGLALNVREFEAESVAYMICARLGVKNPSEQYLANYVEGQEDIPSISLECVMKAAGLIEAMSRKKLKLRKDAKI